MADSLGDPIAGARRLVPIEAEGLLEQARGELGERKSSFGDPGWRERFLALPRASCGAFTATLYHVGGQRPRGDLRDRFVGVHFQDLLHDPVGILDCAYERMGRSLDGEHREATRRYLAEKLRGKLGIHEDTPEDWASARLSCAGNLAPCPEHFEIALE